MRRARFLPAIGALAALLALAAGCKRNAPRAAAPPAPKPVLGAVSVENLTPGGEAAGLDVGAMERELRGVLDKTGLFAAAGAVDSGAGPPPTARVRLAVAAEVLEAGKKAEARAQVRLHVETRPSSAPGAVAFDLEGVGREARTPGVAGGSLGQLAMRVARDLLDSYGAKRRLYEGPPAAVHAALLADGGELREEAIRVVGERNLRDEVPTLLKLLGDPDETVRDTALGALIALRDRRAVPELLARTRSLRDRREMRKIIEAIAILGGQEAEEFLSFVAATHDDDEIRSEAAAARARMLRRETDAG